MRLLFNILTIKYAVFSFNITLYYPTISQSSDVIQMSGEKWPISQSSDVMQKKSREKMAPNYSIYPPFSAFFYCLRESSESVMKDAAYALVRARYLISDRLSGRDGHNTISSPQKLLEVLAEPNVLDRM